MTEKLSDYNIERNLAEIKENISLACSRVQRDPSEITLLAATKTVTPENINRAIAAGVRVVGENRVQELLSKYEEINKENIEVHFIGRLQTNKVKYIVDKADLIHSVDSLKLAAGIDRAAEKISKIQDVLVEVNIGAEETKSGVSPDKAVLFADSLRDFRNLRVRGIMSIPPVIENEEQLRAVFRRLFKIYVDICKKNSDNKLNSIFSVGMSEDYIIAIEEGSNMIRVGTRLFGVREYKK